VILISCCFFRMFLATYMDLIGANGEVIRAHDNISTIPPVYVPEESEKIPSQNDADGESAVGDISTKVCATSLLR
jgi:hypothetical protein